MIKRTHYSRGLEVLWLVPGQVCGSEFRKVDSNQIFMNDIVSIHHHLWYISSQIIKCKIFGSIFALAKTIYSMIVPSVFGTICCVIFHIFKGIYIYKMFTSSLEVTWVCAVSPSSLKEVIPEHNAIYFTILWWKLGDLWIWSIKTQVLGNEG